MHLVLENRPYHFAKWMVILQRWEPSVDRSFPSQIPFWVKVQGIPKNLWSEETFKSIGNDIGIYEKQEITDSSAKMRVQINGLIPLVMSSIVEFEDGFEITTHLVYERLEMIALSALSSTMNNKIVNSPTVRILMQRNLPSLKTKLLLRAEA